MRYKENFKKGMVRLIISTGISYKKLSELTTISQPTLKKWDDEYRQECLDEKKREAEKLKKHMIINPCAWYLWISTQNIL